MSKRKFKNGDIVYVAGQAFYEIYTAPVISFSGKNEHPSNAQTASNQYVKVTGYRHGYNHYGFGIHRVKKVGYYVGVTTMIHGSKEVFFLVNRATNSCFRKHDNYFAVTPANPTMNLSKEETALVESFRNGDRITVTEKKTLRVSGKVLFNTKTKTKILVPTAYINGVYDRTVIEFDQDISFFE